MGQLQRKIETMFWGRPPTDPKERKLVRKLDMVILSYVSVFAFRLESSFVADRHRFVSAVCLSALRSGWRCLLSDWINYVDRANLNNAYVTGECCCGESC